MVLTACSSGDEPTRGASPAAATAATAATAEDSPAAVLNGATSRLVDVGDGRQLHVECAGEGSPTILLESGDESGVSQWSQVFEALAARTRTCAYDRAGVGSSSAATGCRELDDLLDDTEAVLAGAGIAGPRVLVGTSGGGFLMAGLAARHPEDVAGLVLLDTPRGAHDVPPELAEMIRCDAPTNVEHRDYVAVEQAVWNHRKRLGDFPLVVVSNDLGLRATNADERHNVADQRGWFVLSPTSRQVVVNSGHDVANAEAPLVTKLVLRVVDAVRSQ